MTQHDTEHLLEQLAQTLPEGRATLDGVLTQAKDAHRRHTRRRRFAVAGAVVAVVGVGFGVPVALATHGDGRGIEVATDTSDPTTSPASPSDSLTPPHMSAARTVLSTYMDENPDANVHTAWARHERGTVNQPNIGECTSGELLRVNLFGSFPIVTSGVLDPDNATAVDGNGSAPSRDGVAADPHAGTVTEVRLVADAQTKEVCQLSVVTGTHDPDPRDQQIYPETPEGSAPGAETSGGDVSLDGTYRVTALVGPDGASLLTGPFADRLTMTFDRGQMIGSSGCNEVGVTYRVDGRDLRFVEPTYSSQVGCDEPPLVERLFDVRHVSRDGDTIYLHAENWMIVVGLRP